MALDRRTQLLLDDRRHELLRRKAAATGRSMGELIREAIDRSFADDESDARRREHALESFLAAEPMPVEDWPVLEREIEQLYERGGGEA
ncbi:MAG: ribbon-helix-helix protein, CopG family [Thermoleophilaceae bacterium]